MTWQPIKCFFGFHIWVISKNTQDGFAQKICSACHESTNKITYDEYMELNKRQ